MSQIYKCLFRSIAIVLNILLPLSFAGCVTSNYAPVDAGNYNHTTPDRYCVKKNDTLYSIAFAYGFDFRTLARLNNITPPYKLRLGQQILINPMRLSASRFKLSKTKTRKSNKLQTQRMHRQLKLHNKRSIFRKKSLIKNRHLHLEAIKKWHWPANGKIINGYSPANGNKGINIAGHPGNSILATADGIVVYAGSGLPAYGKLVIVKHNGYYLSAYAHNKAILVKNGQRVYARQRIALMGHTGTSTTMLHFEIRYLGKPVNPLKYLATY